LSELSDAGGGADAVVRFVRADRAIVENGQRREGR
jgi:hypothetical protein